MVMEMVLVGEALVEVLVALAQVMGVVVVSNTSHKTDHHPQDIECHGNCTLEHHQLPTNNGCNHPPWFPHNNLGNQCSFPCNMTHMPQGLFCRSLLVTLPQTPLVFRFLESYSLVEPKAPPVALGASNLLGVALNSSKPDSPGHHLPCMQFHEGYMEEIQEIPSSSLRMCHPCVPRSSLYNCGKCPNHSMVHTLDCHTDQEVAVVLL